MTTMIQKHTRKKKTFLQRLWQDKAFVLLALPGIAFYIIFHYVPMYGVWMAFTNYNMSKPIILSDFVGIKWFEQFFNSYFCGRLIRNTLTISLKGLFFSFPIPILFAIILNEVRHTKFKRTVQTVSYLPHFISTVVAVGILKDIFSAPDGIINQLIVMLGGKEIHFFNKPQYFHGLYIGSGIWSSFGWGSILYIAAIAGIDPQLYEAATIDGANRPQQIWHVTIPGILPTVVMMLIMNVGSIMSVGYEKIILMYGPSTYETADVISTYVYRRGLVSGDYSFGAAIGLFNNVINLILLLLVNKISRKVADIALW
ncbi:MAG: sugar ABC transporter permease [Clostridia bacterium]|nr:sugar ABC transporter permease [Clostridia bacterium]MBQ6804522.1 sugar ABC transporter permease [Clostridia bacterium]